jgi:all-trans-8'-apo-beta-carotenal 15,15'-oxygenase
MSTAVRTDELAFRRAMGRCFKSLAREHGFEPLAVEGELPGELCGTLYRNGPMLFEAQGTPYVNWLDGDGGIAAVRLRDGRAEGAVRVTVTRALAEERAAGRMIYSSGFTVGPVWHKRLFGGGKNGTNVHVLHWRGRVFAMPENGLPHEIDPETLETKGPWKLDGALRQLLNAHVRVHPETGVTYAFGVSMGMRNTLDVYALGDDARLLTAIPMKRPVMVVHDLALSERHLVLVQHPLRIRLTPILLGMGSPVDAITWHPDDGSEILVVPLDRPDDVIRIGVPAFFHFHYANAFDDEGSLAVDFCRYDAFSMGDAFSLDALRSGEGWTRAPVATVCRARLDLAARTATFSTLWGANVDFPSTHPQKQGRRARYLWGLVVRDHTDVVEKLDLDTREVTRSDLGPLQCPGEPTFVPRPGGDEDDGWILTLVYDAVADDSYLAVLDARTLALVGKARFDHPIPFPLHGTWVPA